MPAHYSPEALKFLRSLARHNDRAWFDPRKPIYERELKAPTLALIEEVNQALAAFAPHHVRPAHKTMMRIYRDTRFDASRGQEPRPYKTQVAAWFGYNGPGPKVAKTSGAGFYFHLSARELTIAAGCYMPGPDQLLAIRRHLLHHHAELRRLLSRPKLKAVMHEFEGIPLKRPPRGFAPDTPGLDLIQCRQWGVSAQLPPEAALGPELAEEITTRFRLAAPVVHLLNAAIVGAGAGDQPAI
jgi:uncharacterized protein (TIGR02453 family)